jgi:hypothetical protein
MVEPYSFAVAASGRRPLACQVKRAAAGGVPVKYMLTYDLMESARNTNQWLGATARAWGAYPLMAATGIRWSSGSRPGAR